MHLGSEALIIAGNGGHEGVRANIVSVCIFKESNPCFCMLVDACAVSLDRACVTSLGLPKTQQHVTRVIYVAGLLIYTSGLESLQFIEDIPLIG